MKVAQQQPVAISVVFEPFTMVDQASAVRFVEEVTCERWPEATKSFRSIFFAGISVSYVCLSVRGRRWHQHKTKSTTSAESRCALSRYGLSGVLLCFRFIHFVFIWVSLIVLPAKTNIFKAGNLLWTYFLAALAKVWADRWMREWNTWVWNAKGINQNPKEDFVWTDLVWRTNRQCWMSKPIWIQQIASSQPLYARAGHRSTDQR